MHKRELAAAAAAAKALADKMKSDPSGSLDICTLAVESRTVIWKCNVIKIPDQDYKQVIIIVIVITITTITTITIITVTTIIITTITIIIIIIIIRGSRSTGG
jgi:hypothetical protein